MNQILPNVPVDDAISIDRFIKSRVKQSGSSFYWAMRLMAPQKRNAMYAVYAFCREVDDIADGDAPEAEKRADLIGWREEVENIYLATPTTLLGQSLIPAVTAYELVKQDFLDVLDGMEMDISKNVQIANLSDLELYCDRVACSVGRLSNRIFGLEQETGYELAKSLGEALQLTNILRDVHEDFSRGNIYLPKILLSNHGMNTSETAVDINHPAVGAACGSIAEIAGRRFIESAQILADCDPENVRPARIMMTVYRRLLDKLHDRGWSDLETNVRLSNLEKIYLVMKSAYFA